MEQTPKPKFSDFEQDGVLKPVYECARKIAYALGGVGYSCAVHEYNNSLLIILSEVNPLTLPAYNSIIEDYTEHGIVISFNEDEQIIRVSPFKN
jgi:hypothetical protein